MKQISFYPSSKEVELVVPPPKPAKNYIQNWYKEKKFFKDTNIPEYKDGRVKNLSVKACVPFYDAMTTGYIQETWCDIYIKQIGENKIEYHYSGFPEIIGHREKQNVPESDIYYDLELIWHTPWIPKTPKGYSVLSVTPQNFILPFRTFSGVIDSDVFYHTLNGSVPFYIKKGFSGIIPAGTPMYQFIMIKRENWKHNVEKWNEDEALSRLGLRVSKFIGLYRHNFHIKKRYM